MMSSVTDVYHIMYKINGIKKIIKKNGAFNLL